MHVKFRNSNEFPAAPCNTERNSLLADVLANWIEVNTRERLIDCDAAFLTETLRGRAGAAATRCGVLHATSPFIE
jgi:hypothetical protein